MATRAELLVLCQERGFKATGWSKPRMEQELGLAASAPQVATSEPERDPDERAAKAILKRMTRVGPCEAKKFSGPCQCLEWSAGWVDSHHLQLCSCGHTQDSHQVPA